MPTVLHQIPNQPRGSIWQASSIGIIAVHQIQLLCNQIGYKTGLASIKHTVFSQSSYQKYIYFTCSFTSPPLLFCLATLAVVRPTSSSTKYHYTQKIMHAFKLTMLYYVLIVLDYKRDSQWTRHQYPYWWIGRNFTWTSADVLQFKVWCWTTMLASYVRLTWCPTIAFATYWLTIIWRRYTGETC